MRRPTPATAFARRAALGHPPQGRGKQAVLLPPASGMREYASRTHFTRPRAQPSASASHSASHGPTRRARWPATHRRSTRPRRERQRHVRSRSDRLPSTIGKRSAPGRAYTWRSRFSISPPMVEALSQPRLVPEALRDTDAQRTRERRPWRVERRYVNAPLRETSARARLPPGRRTAPARRQKPSLLLTDLARARRLNQVAPQLARATPPRRETRQLRRKNSQIL